MADWVESGRLEAGGKALEYRCHGPAPSEGPTVVMLHEGLGSMGLWRDLPEALAEATGWGVLAYSRAGYGRSDPADLPRPLDYMTREAVDVLPVVLDGLGVGPCVLMGHSDGATIAAVYAGSVQDHRVRGLVLMAPHFFAEPDGLAEIARAKVAFEEGDLRDRLARHHDDAEATFRGWNDAWLDPGFADWNVSDVIDYLRVPTLAIQGRDDPYGTLAQVAEIEGRAYSPVDVLILEGCGHAPHLDRRDDVVAAVTEFAGRLAEIEAAAGAPA